MSSYAVVYQRALRKPLYDPKPIVVRKAPPPKPKLGVELVGTVVEPGFTYGLFRTKSGRTKLVTVGGEIEGAQLAGVRDGSATLRFNDELITLEVKPKGAGK